MKRNYTYEKEMLHWLDGGEIEQKYIFIEDEWEPFNGDWAAHRDMEYRIAEPKEKPKEERWLYVNKIVVNDICVGLTTLTTTPTSETIGKIRMEDV